LKKHSFLAVCGKNWKIDGEALKWWHDAGNSVFEAYDIHSGELEKNIKACNNMHTLEKMNIAGIERTDEGD
jgi:hypothetical protein